MINFEILYDELHEARWFKSLHPHLTDVTETSITEASGRPMLQRVLAYDRPDIILLNNGIPILVVEETVEVPSGHNVGQRFARIAAAAEAGIPSVYFGPYMARKHGGETEGPRYMNLRLFGAIDNMISVTRSAVTTINWPVDANCEIMKGSAKDQDMREYMSLFLELYYKDPTSINANILNSSLQSRLVQERDAFVSSKIRNALQYDSPPNSVMFLSGADLSRNFPQINTTKLKSDSIVLYNVGMTKIRSDPYTGMGILYKYLYIVGQGRKLVLWFPYISSSTWMQTASTRKDKRLFMVAGDAIIFSDEMYLKHELQ
jgi:hypothetical protein